MMATIIVMASGKLESYGTMIVTIIGNITRTIVLLHG